MESSTAEFLVAVTASAQTPTRALIFKELRFILRLELDSSAELQKKKEHYTMNQPSKMIFQKNPYCTSVTPKGVPRLAECHAKVTRELASSKLLNRVPRKKLM